jgi:hypothetical protein
MHCLYGLQQLGFIERGHRALSANLPSRRRAGQLSSGWRVEQGARQHAAATRNLIASITRFRGAR